MNYPVDHAMPNGATVGDWLGSAAANLHAAADMLQGTRHKPDRSDAVERVNRAIQTMEQVLDEVREVQSAAAHVKAYGS